MDQSSKSATSLSFLSRYEVRGKGTAVRGMGYEVLVGVRGIPTLDTQYLVRVLLHRFCDVVCLEARNGATMAQYCAAIGGGLAQILQKLKDVSFGHARNAGRARGSPSEAKF